MVDSAIRALAKVGLVDRPLHDVLQEITDIANGAVPGAEATSITLLRGEEAFTAAYTGQMALDADELQYAKGYGPCMDAGRSGLVLIVDDTAQEGRWPDYAREVNKHGVGSSLSIPLPYQAATIGAVDLYASRPRSFGPESVEAGEEIATYIAVAVANADAHAEATTLAGHMRQAMQSRAVIDIAKGILVGRHHCTPDEAFAMLSAASQSSNRKLRDLAQAMVESESSAGSMAEDRSTAGDSAS